MTLYRVLWLRTEATIQASAQENSNFIESVRAIQSLKLFNRETERESQWLNRYAEVASANVRLGRAKIAFSTMNDLIFGLETIVTIYLAARLVLANQLTVGMVFAFMAYRQHFIDKSVALVEKALDFRILGLHLERLSDIALTPCERGHDQPLSYTRPILGRIELRNVFFRYAEAEPFVLEDINLTIEPGEFITIMGPSGGGQNHAGQGDGGSARADERRSPGRRRASSNGWRTGIPRASCCRDARRPAAVRIDCR